MSVIAPIDLEEAIRQSGEGWVVDGFGPPSEAMGLIRGTLEEVNRAARSRLGRDAPDLSEPALLAEYARNPLRVRGFFQALGVSRTPEMLLMSWRIIQGMAIKEVELGYRQRESFEIRVILESPDPGGGETYVSTDIDDFRIFRHVGIMKLGEDPVFDGFYPLQLLG